MKGRSELVRDLGALAGIWLVVAALIVISRAPAADTHRRVKETSDVYVLPPPEEVVAMSLGHRAALADYLWAGVLVEQGLHSFDRRPFENLPYLVDTINALDPTFREPYLLIEALTIFQVNETPIEDIRRARQILERGVKNLPGDTEILVAAGSFIGLMAPASYLTDPAEKEQWTIDGSAYLEQAAELGGDKSFVGWQALSGFRLLRRSGKQREAVRFLERTLASTDDRELQQRVQEMLDRMSEIDGAYQQSENRKAEIAARKRQERVNDLIRTYYRVVPRTGVRVMGPPYDAAYCAGGSHRESPRCALDWAGWAARIEASQNTD